MRSVVNSPTNSCRARCLGSPERSLFFVLIKYTAVRPGCILFRSGRECEQLSAPPRATHTNRVRVVFLRMNSSMTALPKEGEGQTEQCGPVQRGVGVGEKVSVATTRWSELGGCGIGGQW